MPLWKLVPNTHPTDPRWQDRPIYDEVLIRAATSGQARRVAARFELGLAPDDTARAVGNGSEPLGSALEDEKLYHLLALPPEAEVGPDVGPDVASGFDPAPAEEAVLRAVRRAAAEEPRPGGASGPGGPRREPTPR